MSLQDEADRRTASDGIPRYITEDGTIMKYDWELDLDELQDALTGETLEEYVAKLLSEQ